jgi:CBS-domain-containing membrane protein
MAPSHRTVEDVMTTPVVTADRLTPYKEIARLLAEHRISGLPVLVDGWQVVGVVSEADLLTAQEKTAQEKTAQNRTAAHPGLTAGELMTAPAVTIQPDATIPAAVHVMNTHHVRRLPVTGADRQLIGIVSRRDVLGVVLRPDTDISRDVRRILGEIPLATPVAVDVTVRHGMVILAGTATPAPGGSRRAHDLIPLAIELIWGVEGVLDVVTRLSPRQRTPPDQVTEVLLGGDVWP